MLTPHLTLLAPVLAVLLASPARAQWACPPSGSVPASFSGYFTAGDATITLTHDAVLIAGRGDAVPSARCVSHVFANPNKPTQAFLTYGNAANFANDTDTGCAFLDLSSQSAVRWAESLDESSCPLMPSSASAYGGWSSPASTPAACPTAAQVPASLRGVGILPDGDGTVDSRLVISAVAVSNVTAGSFVAPGCVASVSDAGAGVTALTLSARKDGRAQSCVWMARSGTADTLAFKAGVGAACPTNFTHAQSIPFKFEGVVAPRSPFAKIFTEHAVIQMIKPVKLYGFVSPSALVNVTFDGVAMSGTADSTGFWSVMYEGRAAGGPYKLSAISSDGATASFSDVLVGIVIACSGQSNMDMSVSYAFNATAEEAAAIAYPTMRYFYVGANYSSTPLVEFISTSPWTLPTSANAQGGWSAVCWYAARDTFDGLIAAKRQVPVGMIHSALGGTPIQEWMSPAAAKACPPAQPPMYPTSSGLYNAMIYPLWSNSVQIEFIVWYQCAPTRLRGHTTIRVTRNLTRPASPPLRSPY